MKWTGLGVIALAAVVAIGCERNTADDRDESVLENRDDRGRVGTSGIGDDDRGLGGDGAGVNLGLAGPRDSREFVTEVSMVNHAEVEMAQLALQRAQSAEVKQFAQMMIRDHTKAGNELKQAVSRHNVTVTAHMDDKHQSVMDRLKTLRGAEFDREYMNAMVEGHQDAKNLISSRADATGTAGSTTNRTGTTGMDNRTGTTTGTTGADRNRGGTTGTAQDHNQALDTAVSQWASKTLPTVEQHLQRAQQIRDKVSGTAGTAGTTTNRTGSTTGTTGSQPKKPGY